MKQAISSPALVWSTMRIGSLALLFLAFCATPLAVQADSPIFKQIRQVASAQPPPTDPEYCAFVKQLIKAHPDQLDAIVAEAVKDLPRYACDVIKTGIQALSINNALPEPREVASLVATVVQNIVISNPELVDQIVTCATEADPAASPQILAAVLAVTTGPNSVKSTTGQTNLIPNSVMSPTVAPTPNQMTPVTPI